MGMHLFSQREGRRKEGEPLFYGLATTYRSYPEQRGSSTIKVQNIHFLIRFPWHMDLQEFMGEQRTTSTPPSPKKASRQISIGDRWMDGWMNSWQLRRLFLLRFFPLKLKIALFRGISFTLQSKCLLLSEEVRATFFFKPFLAFPLKESQVKDTIFMTEILLATGYVAKSFHPLMHTWLVQRVKPFNDESFKRLF